MTAPAAPKLVTAEERLVLASRGRFELVNGELIEMLPPGFGQGVIAMALASVIAEHAHTQKLGRVVAAETGFRNRCVADCRSQAGAGRVPRLETHRGVSLAAASGSAHPGRHARTGRGLARLHLPGRRYLRLIPRAASPTAHTRPN